MSKILRPLSISLTFTHAGCAWLSLVNVPACIPLLLSLKTAPLLQGVSAIANTRLGQSGSSPQRDTVHNTSLQRVRDIPADRSPPRFLAKVAECAKPSRYCYRGRPVML
jgi:hypothetical protein